MRKVFFLFAWTAPLFTWIISLFWPPFIWAMPGFLLVIAIGLVDAFQTKQAIRRNFPVIGNGRYLVEKLRGPVQQYFVESDTDGAPIAREYRSVIYQRAKHAMETVAFGTKRNVYAEGYEWMLHSMQPVIARDEDQYILVGGADCKQPYKASVLNISAMSYGSLSGPAIESLNAGAKMAGFAHNTGEGGISSFHTKPEGDLIWQIGTGYFGCRAEDGTFSPEKFKENALRPSVKMIEIKLSQGAKPGKGGILPAAKVTEEIAGIRGVPVGKSVISPPSHSSFDNPLGLVRFIQQLRELSEGKPIGFKLCVGYRHEFLAICKAMRETGIRPDFIAVDGGEGATGAAPLEFSNSVGSPLDDGLAFVVNALRGFDLRSDIKIFAGGRIFTAFHLLSKLAIGADAGYSARAFMLALGCIHALECNRGTCPTGVTTHNPQLTAGLVVEDKGRRVANLHAETIHALSALLGAVGLYSADDLRRHHVKRRVTWKEAFTYEDLFPSVPVGAFLSGEPPEAYARELAASRSDTFRWVEEENSGAAHKAPPVPTSSAEAVTE